MKYLTSIPWLITALILLATPCATWADTIIVRQDGTGDYTTIGDAIAAAAAGDIINVGPGTYSAHLTITMALTLESASGPEATVIEGGGTGRVLWITGAVGCTVTGFSFTHGWSDTGSAIHIDFGSSVLIQECIFQNNIASHDGGAFYARHAGTYVDVTECQFIANYASHNGGACGVSLEAAVNFTDCVFMDNSTPGISGGIASFAGSTMNVEYCLFVRNQGVACGALRTHDSFGTMRNNTFHDNTSSHHGSVLIEYSPATLFEQNIITSDRSGYGLDYHGEPGSHACNIFFGNAGGGLGGDTMGPNEFDIDPQFCDYTIDNFYLCVTSLGLPDNNECGLMGAFPMGCQDCGPIAIETASWGELKSKYR